MRCRRRQDLLTTAANSSRSTTARVASAATSGVSSCCSSCVQGIPGAGAPSHRPDGCRRIHAARGESARGASRARWKRVSRGRGATCACCARACWLPKLPNRPVCVSRLEGRRRGPVSSVSGRVCGCRRHTHVKLLGCWALFRVLHQALCDHIFQDRGESIALGQLRRRLQHNLLQQVENTLGTAGLVVVAASAAKGELANGQLHDGQTDTPYVRLDCVGRPLYPLGGHVCACSHECLGNGTVKLARDTKVTQLDLAP